jgi:hypothetical protein
MHSEGSIERENYCPGQRWLGAAAVLWRLHDPDHPILPPNPRSRSAGHPPPPAAAWKLARTCAPVPPTSRDCSDWQCTRQANQLASTSSVRTCLARFTPSLIPAFPAQRKLLANQPSNCAPQAGSCFEGGFPSSCFLRTYFGVNSTAFLYPLLLAILVLIRI